MKHSFASRMLSACLLAFMLAFISPVASAAALVTPFIKKSYLEKITPSFLTFERQGGVVYFSVINPGNMSCANLLVIKTTAEEMWNGNPNVQKDYEAHVDTAKAIIANQTADVKVLEGKKDQDVEVYWIKACNIEAEDDDGDICAIGGEELTSSCETYTISSKKKTGFSVNETELFNKSLTPEQIIAKGLLKASKELDEKINKSAAAFLAANTGRNAYDSNGYAITNATTTIPAHNWTSSFFAYLVGVATKNQMGSPYIISGQRLFEANINASMDGANADGKGDAAKYSMLKKYFDLFDLDTIVGDKKLFVVNGGSIAFASKTNYKGVQEYMNFKIFTVPSRNLVRKDGSAVEYEVWYTNRCEGERIFHDFTLRSKYDFFLNPIGCNELNTGILSFTCGA
jgi:hypothetical protein